MKFYNLTFDCNLPTKQQINIPTNTDYKVGVKVTKNGKEVSPLPKNVTLGTLSADTEKTNGYITFTKSAGDDPSYIVEKLNIDEGMEHGIFELSATGQNTTGTTIRWNAATGDAISAVVPEELVGQTLANAAYLSCLWYQSSTEITPEEAWATKATSLLDKLASVGGYNYVIGKSTWKGQTILVTIPNSKQYENPNLSSFGLGDCIMLQTEDGLGWVDFIDRHDFAFNAGDTIYLLSQGTLSNNKYGYAGIALQAGTPITANFDLATNVFKSQMGDKADLDENATTVDFAGEYLDGTSFDFNIITK